MSITHIAPLSYDPTLPPSTEHVGQLAENNIAQILTWKQIIQLPTNLTWRASWYEMLDQYMVQGMFGKPMKKPNDTNALHMLWTYHIYNGNPNTKDPLASERLFWAIVAQEGMVAIKKLATLSA